MKKILNTVAVIGATLSLLVGCATLNKLTPAQVEQIGVVITQVADQGAVYAIQKDARNSAYFKLANQALLNFANGDNLSPASLQSALSEVSGLATNQWVGLAISAVVVVYDVSYSQYISNQLTNAPVAKIWILAVEKGFELALVQTGNQTVVLLPETDPTVPYFIKNGTVDKDAIKAEVKAASEK